MEAIRNWLNSPMNYEAGVQLYHLYGSNAILKRVLAAEDETPFKQKKLREALAQLLKAGVAIKVEKQQFVRELAAVSQQTEALTIVAGPWGKDDPVLDALRSTWKPLYAEMKSLQHRIDDVAILGANDRNKLLEAGQMAIRILNLEEEIAGIYQQRDYYNEHGQLPMQADTEDLPIVDPNRWPLELEKQKRYVRRYTQKISASPNHKNLANWAALLQKAQGLVAHYKKLLKLDE